MTVPISSVSGGLPLQRPVALAPAGTPPAGGGFQELLATSLQQVQGLNAEAQSAVAQSLVGEDLSMVETFTAVREADLALKLMLQIRNKLVDAYQELQQLRF